MEELIPFVLTSITSGVIGNAAYDGIKLIFGSSFSTIESQCKQMHKEQAEDTLRRAIESNSKIQEALVELMKKVGQEKAIIQHSQVINGNINLSGNATQHIGNVYHQK